MYILHYRDRLISVFTNQGWHRYLMVMYSNVSSTQRCSIMLMVTWQKIVLTFTTSLKGDGWPKFSKYLFFMIRHAFIISTSHARLLKPCMQYKKYISNSSSQGILITTFTTYTYIQYLKFVWWVKIINYFMHIITCVLQ